MMLHQKIINTAITDELDLDPRDNDEDEPISWIDGDPVDSNDTPIFDNSGSGVLINAEYFFLKGVI